MDTMARMPFPLAGGVRKQRFKFIGCGSDERVHLRADLAFAPGSTEASASSVWLLLVAVEWLADRFAGWLWWHWVAHWSALRMRGLVHAISGRWTAPRNLLGP